MAFSSSLFRHPPILPGRLENADPSGKSGRPSGKRSGRGSFRLGGLRPGTWGRSERGVGSPIESNRHAGATPRGRPPVRRPRRRDDVGVATIDVATIKKDNHPPEAPGKPGRVVLPAVDRGRHPALVYRAGDSVRTTVPRTSNVSLSPRERRPGHVDLGSKEPSRATSSPRPDSRSPARAPKAPEGESACPSTCQAKPSKTP